MGSGPFTVNIRVEIQSDRGGSFQRTGTDERLEDEIRVEIWTRLGAPGAPAPAPAPAPQ